MKRLIMLAVLCAFVLSAAAASASELKANGYIKGDAVWQKNWDFEKGNDAVTDSTQAFDIDQRIEFSLEFIANENLKSVFTVRIDTLWGEAGEGAFGDTDDIQVRKAYVDFMVPDTSVNVKAGFMGLALPNAVAGSLLMDDRMAAMVVSSPVTDDFALTGAYIRAARSDADLSQLDLYALIADINVNDNVNLKPFFVMAGPGARFAANNLPAGMQSDNSTAGELDGAYWLGLSATGSVAGVNLAGDINYGNVSGEEETNDRSGWAFLASAEYAMDMMTPEAFFIYTSGEDDDETNGSERLPHLGGDWAVGSFWFGGDGWLNGSINGGVANMGFWALGVTLKDIASFNEDMWHIVHVIYAKGTNDKDSAVNEVDANTDGQLDNYGNTLTEEDSLIELDFNTYYKLYDELIVGLELGYINLNADEDVWGADGGSAYKVSTGLKYSF